MRFIGNKDLITSEIRSLLANKGLLDKNLKLFDAFAGTAAVSDSLKDCFNLVVNDMLDWCVVYARGRLCNENCNFEKLGFDPFQHLNSNSHKNEGFFYHNYSPASSQRMYFTAENAGRIDYFRATIESWKQTERINENEYCHLLASLIESISFVANTAGVYGAFLKHWDPRALKPIVFQRVPCSSLKNKSVEFYNKKLEDIIENVECDILYLDPPYTQNQYGTQYHLLQTLILDDYPSISPITGSRPTSPMRSDWSKDYKCHILLDRIISKTKAKYIVFSYSPDGFMSKSFIEACLKRYGKPETYTCKRISYNKYSNHKSKGRKEHFEYLFFVEKKNIKDVHYESPLNYIGSKAKMIGDIKKFLPDCVDTFVDAFGGGFNVGINVDAKKIIYNDINHLVTGLLKSFRENDTYEYIRYVKSTIKKYKLQPKDAENYLTIRSHYNSLPIQKRDPKLLYTILLYGFNQQIRFNSEFDFNNPVGMRWFNDKVLEKMISFSRVIKEKNVSFESDDFAELLRQIDSSSFVYMDPPYRLTTGSYNDGKRGFRQWCTNTESTFFKVVDDMDKKLIKFILSYVNEHKSLINLEFEGWLRKNNYNLVKLDPLPGKSRKELLLFNYDNTNNSSLHNKKPIPERGGISRCTDSSNII